MKFGLITFATDYGIQTPDEVRQAVDLGFQRIVLPLEPQSAEVQRAMLPEYEAVHRAVYVTVAGFAPKNERLGILHESTGRRRGRLFAYRDYLAILERGTEPVPVSPVASA